MTLQAAQIMREPHASVYSTILSPALEGEVEKGHTGKKEAIGGEAGHGREQAVRTEKRTFPKQRKVSSIQKFALLCPVFLTEVLQASHTSLLVTDDSMREQSCFSMLLFLTVGLDLLLALPFL